LQPSLSRARTPVNSEVTANEFRYSNTEPIELSFNAPPPSLGYGKAIIRCEARTRRSAFAV